MEFQNLAQLHRAQAERLGPRIALRYKRHGLYHDVSWADYREQALACAAALVDAGVQPGERVGLLAENRVEWLIADMGIMTAGAVNVPPHAPLTARQVYDQFHHAGVSWAFVSTASQAAKVQEIRNALPELRGIVAFDRAAAGGDCITWSAFLQRGRRALAAHADELERREQALRPDSLATIMYTSGTTGDPKGVMLTHGNLLSNAAATQQACRRDWDAVLLSWLPYSHIYARTVDHYLTLVAGVTLCLAESAETVLENLAEIRPTDMASVPRFYEKVLTAVQSDDPAVTAKRLQAVFGPRIRWLSSGGAPLPLGIARAYQQAGLLVLQGYGLTESSPVISFNRPESYKLQTVGQPIPGVEVRIAPDGEVLTRGPHVMAGYWKNHRATAEAIRDGWLHTGDLGFLDEDGFLTIQGRKKELMVLSNGKKVVTPLIEGRLLSDPCIDQAVIFGEGRSFVTALIVPHWEKFRHELERKGVSGSHRPVEELADDPAATAVMRERVAEALKDEPPWEQVKQVALVARPFSVDGGELTVSLKLRRGVIEQKYRTKIEALYRKGEAASAHLSDAEASTANLE